MQKWYDTIELPELTYNTSLDLPDMGTFFNVLQQIGAANPYGEEFVVRLRKRTRESLGVKVRDRIETPIGTAVVLDR